jgi:iron(III) transport system permease protein
LIRATANTAFVSALAAALAIAAAALLVRSARALKSRLLDALVRVATLGYALPGAVVAIGILFVAGSSTIASAGILLLLYAYLVRFLMAAHGAAAAGAAQIHPLTDDAARSLGASAAKLSFLVHWPLARPALRAGLIVVFIDVARELPATLLLRPFNFDTLATTVFRFASDERLAEAAPAALALIALSLVGAVLISGTDQLFKTARSTAAQM